MPFIRLDDIARREILPGCHVRFVHSENMTFAYWNLDAGAVIPDHSHLHEQVCTVIDGEMELMIDGETRVMTRGQVGVIPSGAAHLARALTECLVQDVFYPIREDYR